MGANNYRYGRQIRQPKKPAPRRCRDRPFLNAAPDSSAGVPGAKPPPRTGQAPAGHLPRRLNRCRPGSAPGMQGAKPLA